MEVARRRQPEAAQALEEAVARSVREGQATPDLGGSMTTSQVGDLLARTVAESVVAHRSFAWSRRW